MRELKLRTDQDEQLLADCIRNLRSIKNGYMTEKKFFSYHSDKSSKKDYDYGREVLKGSLDDRLELPYKKYKLWSFVGGLGRAKGTRISKYM